MSLLIARVNQNNVVQLLRVLGDAEATLSGNPGSSGDASRASGSAGTPSGDGLPPSAAAGTQADTGRSSLVAEPRKKAKLCGAFGALCGKGGEQDVSGGGAAAAHGNCTACGAVPEGAPEQGRDGNRPQGVTSPVRAAGTDADIGAATQGIDALRAFSRNAAAGEVVDKVGCTSTVSRSAPAPSPQEEASEKSEESSKGSETEKDFSDSDAENDASYMFHVRTLAAEQMTWLTNEDAELERIQRLAERLRRRPLLPMKPQGEAVFEEVATGICLPHAHCAFQGCSWTMAKPAFDQHGAPMSYNVLLRLHLCEVHAEDIRSACGEDTPLTEFMD